MKARRQRANGTMLGLGALLAVPLLVGGALAVLALQKSPLDAAATAGPLVGTVTEAQREDRANVAVTLAKAAAFGVVSQSSGTVTGLFIEPGSPVVAGAPAMEIDGLPVLAYVAPAPLYRDIERGMQGKDVETAQTLLVELGYLEAADGKAGSMTAKAVGRFNKDHGRGANGELLAVDSLLWIPADSVPPVEVRVRIGAMVARGDELFTTSTAHDSLSVAVEPSKDERTLTVAGSVVRLPAGAAAVTDPADVAAIEKALNGLSSQSASVALSTPRVVGTIPASAVVTDPGGGTCFFADVTGKGIRIEATDGTFGMVDVPAAMVGERVLINPREVREDLRCG